MTALLARAIFPDVNGNAADASVNDFAFDTAHTPAAVAASIIAAFNTVYVLGQTLGSFLGMSRSRVANASLIQVYDITGHLDGSPHGSPVAVVPWTLSGGGFGGNNLPDQLSICLSLHAVLTGILEHGPSASRPTMDEAVDLGAPATHMASTRPRSTLRGRIFIGPITAATQTTDGLVNSDGFGVAGGFANGLLALEPGWSVWSRTTASLNHIVGGWVDKEYCVIRRRKDRVPTRFVWA